MIARCGGLPGEQKETLNVRSSPQNKISVFQKINLDWEQNKQSKHEELDSLLTYNAPLACSSVKNEHAECGSGQTLGPQDKFSCQWEKIEGCFKKSVIKFRPMERYSTPAMKYDQPILSSQDRLESAPVPCAVLTCKSEQHEPLDMRVKQCVTMARTDGAKSNAEDAFGSICSDSSITHLCSSVIQFAPRSPCRPQVVSLKEENSDENKEVTEKTIRDNPVLPFTLEEEFKVIDFIVRMQDYIARRFIFIDKNFGDNIFPNYSQLTRENAVCTNISGKLPYNPVMEGRLFDLGFKFTQLNIDHFFDDMKYLSEVVKMDMLETSFPATSIIFYGIMENNNWMQPQSLGREKVGNIRMANMERFSSPWAVDFADEVKFESIVQKVGEVLGSDMKLQALFTMLVMITPWNKQVCNGVYLIKYFG